MITEMIKDVVMNIAMDMPSTENRNNLGRILSKTVFAGMSVTDITTPEEVVELKLVFAIDLPNNGGQKVLMIDTANGITDKDNIKINLQ